MAEVAVGIAISVAVSAATTVIANALEPTNEATRLSDINPLKAAFGESLPFVYGTAKLGSNIFWSPRLTEEIKDKAYRYRGEFLASVCLTPDTGVFRINKVWANKRLLYFYQEPAPQGKEKVFLRLGNVNQNRISEVVAIEGSNTPNFKNVCYVYFRKKLLTKFGNALPSLEVEVQSHEVPPSLKFVLDDVMVKAKIPSTSISYLDIDYFNNQQVKSAVLRNDGTTYRQFLEELQLLYNFSVRERNGKIEFIPTESRRIVPVPLQKMGCQEDSQGVEEQEVGSDGSSLYIKQEEFEVDLPSSVEVEYLNVLDNSNKHTAIYRDVTKRHDNPKNISFSFLRLDKTQAANFAQRAFNYAYNVSRTYSGMTFPYLIHNSTFQTGYNTADTSIILPGDTYQLPLESGAYNQLVTSMEITPGFIQSVSSHEYLGSSVFVESVVSEGFIETGVVSREQEGKPILLETSPLKDVTSVNIIDLLIGADTPPLGFQGGEATLGSNSVGNVNNYTSKGSLSTALPKTSHLIADEITTMTLTCSYPLAVISQSDWLDAKQVLLVGQELILVREAVLISSNTYACKGLIRGWQGTEKLILNPAPAGTLVYRVQYEPSPADYSTSNGQVSTNQLGVTSLLSIRGFDQDATDILTESVLVSPSGRSLKPFAPVDLTYTLSNLKLSWSRRSRGFFSNSFAVPLNEVSESYKVEFYSNSSFSTLLLSLTSNSESVTLTSNQDTLVRVNGLLHVKVAQVSFYVGDGFYAQESILGV